MIEYEFFSETGKILFGNEPSSKMFLESYHHEHYVYIHDRHTAMKP